MVKLTVANSISEADLLKSILESSGIKAELKDEETLKLQPDIVFGIQGIEIMVDEENLAKAKGIIKFYTKNK